MRNGGNFVQTPSIDANINLTPIVTDNVDVGFDYQGEDFIVKMAYFVSQADFGARLQRNSDGIYEVKREENQIKGLETSATWYVSNNDDVGVNLALSEGRYDSNNDGDLDTDLDGSNISPDRFNIFWQHVFDNDMVMRWQANILLDRDFKDDNDVITSSFDGYTTLDASFSSPVGSGQLNLGVQNITNTDYYNYYSQTVGNDSRYFKGRGALATISYSMQF